MPWWQDEAAGKRKRARLRRIKESLVEKGQHVQGREEEVDGRVAMQD